VDNTAQDIYLRQGLGGITYCMCNVALNNVGIRISDGLAHVQVPPHEGSKGFAAVLSFFLLPRQQFPAPGSNLLPHSQNNLSAVASVLRSQIVTPLMSFPNHMAPIQLTVGIKT
jgi:hypothetical protein